MTSPLEVRMANDAVVADGVAGSCRMVQIPRNSRHPALIAFCEASLNLSE